MKSNSGQRHAAMSMVLACALLWPARLAPQSRTAINDISSVNSSRALYDPNPNHPWNRVHRCLYVRQGADGIEHGFDSIDPLLWSQTKHLLTGESHRDAIRCLDEFLEIHAETLITDPMRRALFQHDLWAVFDWVAARQQSPSQRALLARLGAIIRRVALTPEQIRRLPDTYEAALTSKKFPVEYDPGQPARPFLPRDFFRSDGPWICLSGYSAEPTAMAHFTGRSRFLVFMRLPGGRGRTLEYIRSLRASGEVPIVNGDGPLANTPTYLNLKLPQFSIGTEVALIRQMILIDAGRRLQPSPIVESVQIRVYHTVTPGTRYVNFINGPSSHDQDFFEFRLSRAALFAGNAGGLIPVSAQETEYPVLFSQGVDPFELPEISLARPVVVLDRCRDCHGDSGIHSVQSRLRWMKRNEGNGNPDWDSSLSSVIDWETGRTIDQKLQRPDFKLVHRYWDRAGK